MGIFWEMTEVREGVKVFHVYRQIHQWLFLPFLALFIFVAVGASYVQQTVHSILFLIGFVFVIFNTFEMRELMLAQFMGKEIRYLKSKESSLPTFFRSTEYWIEQ